jgi:hypothetical protein
MGAIMAAQLAVTIIDEIPGRSRQVAFRLELWTAKVTARELIERRVRHEVDVHNQSLPDTFLGLVQPAGSERAPGGWRLKTPRRIDAEEQVASAWDAFSHGRVLLLVDDRQVDTLDDEMALRHDAEVCFYQLVPLVGG